MPDVNILVVAEDPLARAGLATLLGERESLQVIGQLPADENLPDMLLVYRPDVVLWDLGWEPDEAPVLLGESPYPILALLPTEELAADVAAAGAAGILFRSASLDQLEAALLALAQGLALYDPAFGEALRPAMPPALPPPEEELTPREREVLQLLAEGLTNRAIAQELDVSEHTVKFHVNALMSKLQAQSRTEAVVRATRMGLLLL